MSMSQTGPLAPSPRSASLSALLARLDAEGEAMISRTEAWARLNSGSYELAALGLVCSALADAFAALPGRLELAELPVSRRVLASGATAEIEHGASIRVRVRPEAPIQVALTGHYDTVFPAAHPFQATRRERDRLHGPGVADMKGGLSVMLSALLAFETLSPRKVGYEVLLSPDEEIGSPASAPLLAALGARAHLGMTYEPALADGALVDARKGSGNFSLALKGRAAHVGRAFEDGRSAILAAAEAALALDALNGKRAGATFNVGAVDGGGPTNVVPDTAVLRFNARAPDAEGVAWAEAEIGRIARAAGARDGVSAVLHGGFARAPKPITPPQQIMIDWTRAAGLELGLDLKFRPSGGVCEGNNLFAAGCPNIDTLGPCGGGLHSDQEFALLASFAERAKLSFLLLAGFEGGGFDVGSLTA